MKKLLTLLALAFCLNGKAQIITTVAGNGTGAYAGDGGQATAAELNTPWNVVFDAIGNMYIADLGNNCVRKVNSVGIITTFAGTGTAAYSGDGGQATAAELNEPSGLLFDATGNLYIGDQYNQRIRKISTSGIITTIAGGGTSGLGDGGQATDASLNYPSGIVLDAAGNLYIADNNNNRIRKVNSLGIITTIAGNGTNGYSGDGGQATNAELNIPTRVALDNSGNLYISDLFNNVIRTVNSSGIINTIIGGGSSGLGDGGEATACELDHPDGINFDVTGNFYIADVYNNRVRMVNTLGIISTVVGDGTQGFSGDGGQATAAELYDPIGVSFDASGNMYIAEYYNNRIRKVTKSQTAGIEQFTNNNEQVNIYPNPNNGTFVIEPSNATKQTMQVYDVNGKMVLSQTINGKTNIDAGILNEGVYNISLQSNEGVVNKRLVIVR